MNVDSNPLGNYGIFEQLWTLTLFRGKSGCHWRASSLASALGFRTVRCEELIQKPLSNYVTFAQLWILTLFRRNAGCHWCASSLTSALGFRPVRCETSIQNVGQLWNLCATMDVDTLPWR